MFDALATLLAYFYEVVPNYAIAIAIFTLAIMVAFTPLTIKGTRSMMAMQRLQPEMKRIQEKNKGDRETLNKEMMAFYQENQINPLGSCLPLLVQAPVFFILFQVLRGLTRRGADGLFDPKYIHDDSALHQALSKTDEMRSFGLDLAVDAQSALRESMLGGFPYLLLIGVVGLTGWVQQRQMATRRDPNSAMPAQQQMIMRIMPFFLPVISFSLPAGIVVYFVISNLYRVGQQAWIQRTMYSDEEKAKEKTDGKKRDKADRSQDSPEKNSAPSNGKGSASAGKGSTKKADNRSRSQKRNDAKAKRNKAAAAAAKKSSSNKTVDPRPRQRRKKR